MYAELGVREHCHQRCFVPKVLTPTAKRAVIESMVVDHQLSRSKACKLVGDALNAIVAVRAGVFGCASSGCVKMAFLGTTSAFKRFIAI